MDDPAILDAHELVSHGDLATFANALRVARRVAGVHGNSTIATAVRDDLITAALIAEAPRIASLAPLDPSLRRGQFQQRFAALRTGLVVVDDPADTAAAVATEMGLGVISIKRTRGVAWRDTALDVLARCDEDPQGHPEQPALILHTGGTSGSPSMVPISHENLAASVTAMADTFGLGPDDRSLVVLPLFHVHSILSGVVVPLAVGGSVACPGLYNGGSFLGWLTAFAPTYYSAVPTVHSSVNQRLVRHPDELGAHNLRFIRSSSAPLGPRVRVDLEAAFGVPVVEGYAMTEGTSQITSNPLPPGVRKDFSVGTSVGPEIRIAADDDTPLPSGHSGRVLVRGPSIVDDYLNDPALTSDRFLDGWLATGDIGYLDDDDYLFLTGRSSDRIRRGGVSVSPADIESCLLDHVAVREATVFAVPDRRLGEQVGAVVVADPGTNEQDLRDHVFEHRTPADVPRRILLTDTLPTGATGKPRRTGLAELFGLRDLDEVDVSPTPRPPNNATERAVAALWTTVLGAEVDDAHDNFFALGGDSLRIKELIVMVRDQFGVDVPFVDFFDALTVASQATVIERSPTSSPDPSDAGPAQDRHEPFALSRAQERLWVLEQLEPGAPDYHIPWRARVRGPVELDRLERALQAVVDRHEPLRTIITNDRGEPRQHVRDRTTITLHREKWSIDAHTRIAAHTEAAFDLGADLLLRALVLSAGDDHLVCVVIHHLAADGRSLQNFVTDLTDAYRADQPLPPLDVHYADFVQWEQRRLDTPGYRDDLDLWRQTFSPLPERPALPGGSVPDAPPGGPAHTEELALSSLDPAAVRAIARRAGATPFMVLLAGVARALALAQDHTDIVIGTPSEDRVWSPAAPMIGYFVNTLPLRVDLSGGPTALETVRRVKRVALDAYARAGVCFDDIVGAVNPPRDPTRTPLFDVMFTATQGSAGLPTFAGTRAEAVSRQTDRVKFPIEIDMRVEDDRVTGWLACDARWFKPTATAELAELVGQTVCTGVQSPERAGIRPRAVQQ